MKIEVYFRIEDARRSVGKKEGDVSCDIFWGGRERAKGGKVESVYLLRSSLFLAFSSLTRLARMAAYSFCLK